MLHHVSGACCWVLMSRYILKCVIEWKKEKVLVNRFKSQRTLEERERERERKSSSIQRLDLKTKTKDNKQTNKKPPKC